MSIETIKTDLVEIQKARDDIKLALENKKQIVGKDISTYANAINNIDAGININGTVERYKVSSKGDINAGDFVTFINELNEKRIGDITISVQGYISAIALSQNKAFITYGTGSGRTKTYLYGVVCTFDGEEIIIGESIQLSTDSKSGIIFSPVALKDNLVFIAYASTSGYQLNAMICSIEGDKITIETDIILNEEENSGGMISAIKLAENKVFLAHSQDPDNYYLNALICTINGTEIVAGNDTQLISEFSGAEINSGYYALAVALRDNLVFIVHSTGETFKLNGSLCIINDTEITLDSQINLCKEENSGIIFSAVVIAENKILIAYKSLNSNTYIYYSISGIICEILDSPLESHKYIIAYGKNTQLQLGNFIDTFISAIKLAENKVLILHESDSENYYLSGTLCFCDEDKNIIPKMDIQLSADINSGEKISAVLLNENQIFISNATGEDAFLNGILMDNFKLPVKSITTDTEDIVGIAKTAGQVGEEIEVVVPTNIV